MGAEPEPDPELTPEPTSEVEPTSSEPEPEHGGHIAPEPVPEWSNISGSLKVAWQTHVYLEAVIFAIIFVISFYNVCYYMAQLVRERGKATRFLNLTLSIMTCWFSLMRSFLLFCDPYGTNGILPPLVYNILFSLGWPALTGIFTLLFAVLLDTTRMSIGPPVFQKGTTLFALVLGHTILVITVDLLVSFFAQVRYILLVCQVLFFAFGSIIGFGFAFVAWKINRNLAASDHTNSKTKLLLGYVLAFCVDAFVMSIAHAYAAFGVFGVLRTSPGLPEARPWLALQWILRLTEIVACIICLCIVTKSPPRRIQPEITTTTVSKIEMASMK